MAPKYLQFNENVTLLGGAPLSDALFGAVAALAPRLVAADGGARKTLEKGLMPEAVIGDFDSLDDATRQRIPGERLLHIAEQDSTDFEKALRTISAPLVLAAGFTGARLDHELAVYNALVRLPDRRCIVVGEHDLCFHAPPDLEIDLAKGTRVSLFPMAAVGGTSDGLRWPIAGIDFAPDGRVGTSNEAVGPRVSFSFDGPGMLVILPRAALQAAVRALAAG